MERFARPGSTAARYADRQAEAAAALHDGKDCGDLRSGLLAAEMDCVFRSMWAPDSVSCGQRFRCDVGSIFGFTVISAHMA